MPDMVRTLGGHDASAQRRSPRVRLWRFFQDPSNRRYSQMQSCPAQRLGDFDLAHGGAEGFQTLHEVADEVRELIHRLAQLQQCIGTLVIDAFYPPCNRGRGDEEGIGRLLKGPASRGTQLEDRHTFMGAVMRPALRRDLRYSSVFDAELFAHQGTRFVESVVFRRESHPCIDTIGGPGTRVHDGVVGQCNRMDYRRLNAALSALGKMDPRWLRIGEHRDFRKRVLQSSWLKDTIRVVDSKCYGPDREPKDSVGQDRCFKFSKNKYIRNGYFSLKVPESLNGRGLSHEELARISHRYVGRLIECVPLSTPMGNTSE